MHASNVKLVEENVAKQKQFNQVLMSKLKASLLLLCRVQLLKTDSRKFPVLSWATTTLLFWQKAEDSMEEDPVVLSVEKALWQDLTALANLEYGWEHVEFRVPQN